MNITKTVIVAAGPDGVWATIGDFGAIAEWHPWVPNCALDPDGKTRTISLDPTDAIEVLTGTVGYRQLYTVTQSPMAIADYSASLGIESSGTGSLITWTAEFTPLDDEAEAQVEAFFEKGLNALKERFG